MAVFCASVPLQTIDISNSILTVKINDYVCDRNFCPPSNTSLAQLLMMRKTYKNHAYLVLRDLLKGCYSSHFFHDKSSLRFPQNTTGRCHALCPTRQQCVSKTIGRHKNDMEQIFMTLWERVLQVTQKMEANKLSLASSWKIPAFSVRSGTFQSAGSSNFSKASFLQSCTVPSLLVTSFQSKDKAYEL